MTEKQILKEINKMCQESLSPDVFNMWDKVKEQLIKNRKKLNPIK